MSVSMHRVWGEVDLGALGRNLGRIRARLRPDQHLLVVVKADAYGHGAVEVAREAVACGAAFLGVGDSQEGLTLRAAGIREPILVLGALIPGEIDAVLTHGITPCVHSEDKIRLLAKVARSLNRPLGVHLKVDTGMGRLGARPERVGDLLDAIRREAPLYTEGICTHLAAVDRDDPSLDRQLALFSDLVGRYADGEGAIRWRHAANSLVVLSRPGAPFNLVRVGGAAYGIDPTDRPGTARAFEPVLSLHTQVVYLKDLPAGAPVGYAGTWQAPRAVRTAVLPVGYHDGYAFAFGNRAEVLVRGIRAPVIGRVSMDYTTIDVTDIPGVHVGDPVVLLGRQEGAEITLHEMAAWRSTVPYEIPCSLGPRVKRLVTRSEAAPAGWV
ncbi:MAG: alanine racemase [Planctomycetes bacterium]|nr:alanine racemase [Planctomycetota bacterium]